MNSLAKIMRAIKRTANDRNMNLKKHKFIYMVLTPCFSDLFEMP